jgi:hypothetical protein
MATTRSTSSVDQTTQSDSGSDNYSGAAVGLIVFAATLMILAGIMQAIQGLVALTNDKYYVLNVNGDYLFKYDTTSWGWVHLIMGVIVALAGVGLFQGSTWARVVAVMVASVGILVNFVWMPYYPIWSLTLIAFFGFVIWAATAHGRDITFVRQPAHRERVD